MSDFIFALLTSVSIGGLGLMLIILSILEWIYYHYGIPRCTEMTEGKIVKHRYLGGGEIRPIIEYVVGGKVYRTTKKYSGLNEYRRLGIKESKMWEDEKGYLCITGGPIVNIRRLTKEMWPIGSTVNVFYSPGNPKINYVDRPVYKRSMIIIFMILGIILLCWCCTMLFMMQKI